jgi:phosphoglycerate dehydrogenase-like enzyme
LHNLIILSKNAPEYRKLIEVEKLPDLNLLAACTDPAQVSANSPCNILFGDTVLVGKVINILPDLRWVQTTWAGVEPLLYKDLRRDYLLTNARSIFGPLISEYVMAYLLA